jgi:predicted transcriptional regulator
MYGTDFVDAETNQRSDHGQYHFCMPRGWSSKTQVVYKVNLNFHTVNRHLDLLVEKELIEIFQGPPKRYKTTSKGEKALECLKEIEAIYS